MLPSLQFHAAQQSGLFTRAQALASGYQAHEIRRLTLASGPWAIVRRSVYMDRGAWDRLDERIGRPLTRSLAAHFAMNVAHVLSHTSAGWVMGLDMLKPPDDLIHVTRPTAMGSRTEHGVKHHPAPYTADDVVNSRVVPVLGLARTAVDIGREHGHLHGLVACDAARQRGVRKADLVAVIDRMQRWPHVARARSAVLASDPGAESVGETLSREFLTSLGLGPVSTQFSVVCGQKVYFADLRIGRHLIEFDGRLKYQRREDGGIADRPEGQIVWDEKARQNAICAQGYGMSRLTWSEVWGRGRETAAHRITQEYAVTVARFGVDLPAGYTPVPRSSYQRVS